MPWRQVDSMDLRRAFIEEARRGAVPMTELCASYDISRKTGYKWLDRFEREGRRGLVDRSRRPTHTPEAVSRAIVEALLEARRCKPYWGARKLRAWLARTQPRRGWPARSTIHTILRRHGAVRVRRPRRREFPRLRTQALTAARHPNDVWTADFKGSFRLGSGVRCYPLTVRDLASRYVLRCDALAGEYGPPTLAGFARTFAEVGLPRCIRTDNGKPFAGTGLTQLSRLNVWWMRLGIRVERIARGRPDQNGAHERFHRDLKAQTTRPPADTLAAQHRRFTVFRREYNDERPHEALRDQVPAARYRPSPRPLPRRLAPLEYPGHWEPRRVGSNGCIVWRTEPLFLSETLAGETVAFEEVDDGMWTLHFGTVPLARWLERERCFRALRAD